MVFQFLFINGTNQAFIKLQQEICEPFYLTQVTFNSDIDFDPAEFDYLTGLKAGTNVDATDLKMACFYLDQRKIFAKIAVLVTSDSIISKKVHFNLIGHPCLGQLKIEGVLFDKERYRRLYDLEYGARFEYVGHKNAINKIINGLRNSGYLNAQVCSEIKLDKKNHKLVNVKLKINTGNRFKIKNLQVNLHLTDSKQTDQIDLDLLKSKIIKLLSNSLVSQYYASAFLQKELAELKKYLAHHGYPFSQISFNILKNRVTNKIKINLDVFLKEALSYSFAGNNFYNKQDLINQIMFASDPIWRLPIGLVEKDLLDMYYKNGFWQASIIGKQEINKYHFMIQEGVRANIKHILIDGLDGDEQKLVLNKFFKKKIIGKSYHKKKLDQILEKLTDWYHQKGFLDFKILRFDFKSLNESDQSYQLLLFLNKGECYFLKSACVLNYPDLKIPIKLITYKPFKIKDLHQQKIWLCNYFKQNMGCNILAYPIVKDQIGEQGRDVNVEWDVKLEEPGKIGKTIRQGNAQVKFDKLYQNLPYQAGDRWNLDKIQEAVFRVKNFGVFDSVRISPLNILDPLGQKPVVLDLNLDHKFEFRTRLGFQKISKNFVFKAGTTYKIGTSVLYKNVTNCGDQIRFDGDLTKYYRSIVLQYQRPIFIKKPFYFMAKTYTNKYDQPIFIGSKYRLYNVLQQGMLVDIGYKDLALNTDFNFGVEGIEVTNISREYAKAIDFSNKLLCKQVPFLFMEPTILLDYLDDKINPRFGLLTLLTGKIMIAINQNENYFFKFLLEQSVFLPVFSESVFAMRLRMGHIFTNDFSVIMPIERFYLGGNYSLRSYEPDMAPPLGKAILDKNNQQDVSCPKPILPNSLSGVVSGDSQIVHNKLGHTSQNQRVIWLPQGGKSMINISFEFRFPIYQNFGGVIFEDLGTLLKSGQNLGQNSLLTATGFGLRYFTPIGPLRFDIGWRPRNFAWFLTIGHAF